ncbi:MAG: S9 family peptidase [Candidatus Hodarchaeales archaeon]|jgi:oligopeptidase B
MTADKNIIPPIAVIKPRRLTVHGEELVDNYFWLRDDSRKDSGVISYLESENEYTKAIMKHTEKFQKELYSEMKDRIKEDDTSAPERSGDYFYYSRTIKDKQYRTYHRKRKSSEGQEELLLDGNNLAEGFDYFKLGIFKISPNHQLLAYSIDTDGSEQHTIYLKDLTNNKLLSETIKNTFYSFEWINDEVFLYTTLSDIKQPDKVFKHVIGTDSSTDELLYHETDEKFYLKLQKSHDATCIFLSLTSMMTSEVHYLMIDHPNRIFQVIHHREHELEYYPVHWNGKFYIRTNANSAKNFKLMITSRDNLSKENWEEVISHRESVMITDIDVYKNYLILYEREDGLLKVRITNQTNNKEHYVTFPESSYTVQPSHPLISSFNKTTSLIHPEYDTNIIRLLYTSFSTPNSAYDYNMESRELTLIKQEEIIGDFKKNNYITDRIAATAPDGNTIYISLIHKKGIVKDGNNFLLLNGYGAYGMNNDPKFLSSRLSLIDRGVIYAIAHIRGGGEMGRKWYDDGKLLKKMNTFTDFITCAEYLISQEYTSKKNLAITGGSAGGLLMGTVVNMRPELFKLMVTRVPFVDVINSMLDPTIPLTVMEYEEWGNPEQKENYDYMKAYSPYDNVERKNYPHILITAGLNDPRVQYWEPAKWTAKLRALKTDNHTLLLKTDMGSGHAGKSGRYDYLKEIALQYAFILDILENKE